MFLSAILIFARNHNLPALCVEVHDACIIDLEPQGYWHVVGPKGALAVTLFENFRHLVLAFCVVYTSLQIQSGSEPVVALRWFLPTRDH